MLEDRQPHARTFFVRLNCLMPTNNTMHDSPMTNVSACVSFNLGMRFPKNTNTLRSLSADTPKMSLDTLSDVTMAAAEAKPFSTGREMKFTMNPRRSSPMPMHTTPTRNVIISTCLMCASSRSAAGRAGSSLESKSAEEGETQAMTRAARTQSNTRTTPGTWRTSDCVSNQQRRDGHGADGRLPGRAPKRVQHARHDAGIDAVNRGQPRQQCVRQALRNDHDGDGDGGDHVGFELRLPPVLGDPAGQPRPQRRQKALHLPGGKPAAAVQCRRLLGGGAAQPAFRHLRPHRQAVVVVVMPFPAAREGAANRIRGIGGLAVGGACAGACTCAGTCTCA